MPNCPGCKDKQAGASSEDCDLLIAAYVFAGLAMMLNIRLSYSSAPYALIRFRLPENLFSVFVRRMASALELWCLPSMLLGNLMEYGLKAYYHGKYEADWGNGGNLKPKDTALTITASGSTTSNNGSTWSGNTKVTFTFKNILPNIKDLISARQIKFWVIIIPSIISQWLNFLTYVILLIVYLTGGEQGHLTTFYFVIAISGVVFGINMVLVYASDWNYTPVYIVGENSFPIVTSFMHYISTLIFGNRRKWNSDFLLVCIDIWVAIIISFVAAIVWTLAYGYYRNTQKKDVTTYDKGPGGTEPKVESNGIDPTNITTDDINTIILTDSNRKAATYTKVSQGTANPGTPTLTITKDGHETGAPSNFKKDDTPPTCTKGDPNTIILKTRVGKTGTITITGKTTTATVHYGHIFTEKFDTTSPRWAIISPTLMVIVGMGLVYAIYPGIAPGMIVPFYLIDKIEMVLLIATFFPPVIVALLNRGTFSPATKAYSPKTQHTGTGDGFPGWTPSFKYDSNWDGNKDKNTADAYFWHFFDILIVIKISLAIIFIYSLHYRDTPISRSIINQPKMSTFLSIIFYMCHEILLALGFAGVIGNNGGTYVVLPAQYVGALFMIFLAFYSEGYIIEYKSHDPAHWPTEGMTKWNAFCYWCKRASKITNHNLRSLFTTDLRRDLLLCIQKNELI